LRRSLPPPTAESTSVSSVRKKDQASLAFDGDFAAAGFTQLRVS
jgi:hypothetical protein